MIQQLGILVFHQVLKEKVRDRFSIDLDEFQRILGVLNRHGTIRGPGVIAPGAGASPVSFALSFDDGTIDHYENVRPILAAHDARGLFFVSTDLIGREGYLSGRQIAELSASGHVIGSHSRSHSHLTNLSVSGIREEIAGSVSVLERITGKPLEWFAPPEGRYDARVLQEAANLGIRYFRTTDYGWSGASVCGAMRKLNTINVNAHFMSRQLAACLRSKAVFLGYSLAYRAKNGLKRRAPLLYRKLRGHAGT